MEAVVGENSLAGAGWIDLHIAESWSIAQLPVVDCCRLP
jgi:hypothetical protein